MTKNRFFGAIATLAALLLISASSASAAGCPAKPVAESGGRHWCYSAGSLGHVHLWKPSNFKARTAVTVVYVHGHNTGVDGCEDAHYIDCAWDAHGLAAQFSKSGVNALFVAVEGPVKPGQAAKWPSLDALLRSIRHKGGIKPPASVVVMGHSAGIYTLIRFLSDARLKHVVTLDALYRRSPQLLAKWFAAGKRRRLTLVGVEYRYAQTAELGQALSCVSADDLSAPYSAAAKSARCVTTVDQDVGHMDVVRDGLAIPLALSRIVVSRLPKIGRHAADPHHGKTKGRRRTVRHRARR